MRQIKDISTFSRRLHSHQHHHFSKTSIVYSRGFQTFQPNLLDVEYSQDVPLDNLITNLHIHSSLMTANGHMFLFKKYLN